MIPSLLKFSKSRLALAGLTNPAKWGGFVNPPRAFRGLLKLIFILSGGLLGLLLLEIALRLLLPPAPPMFDNYADTYVCSAGFGWLGRPNYQGIIAREEYSHPIKFNAEGMYDTGHALEKEPEVFRILWLGDSFAQALQVAEPETAHQQLEDLLNQRLATADRSFEVISAGVMGWGNGQQLNYYRQQGRLYRPDLVLLLFFMGNDVENNLPGTALTIGGYNCFAPYFPLCQDGQLDPDPWPYIPGLEPAWSVCSTGRKWLASGLSLIQRNSYLFARLEPLLLSFKPIRGYGQNFALPFTALYFPEETEEVQYGWQVTEAILAQFDQEVKADGANFGLAMVGPRELVWLAQLQPDQLQTFYQSQPLFREAQLDYPNRRLANFLQGRQIPVLDLQQPMIDYIHQTGVQLYLPIDRHWTVEGNRLAAELIFTWLLENKLLEQPDHGRE